MVWKRNLKSCTDRSCMCTKQIIIIYIVEHTDSSCMQWRRKLRNGNKSVTMLLYVHTYGCRCHVPYVYPCIITRYDNRRIARFSKHKSAPVTSHSQSNRLSRYQTPVSTCPLEPPEMEFSQILSVREEACVCLFQLGQNHRIVPMQVPIPILFQVPIFMLFCSRLKL